MRIYASLILAAAVATAAQAQTPAPAVPGTAPVAAPVPDAAPALAAPPAPAAPSAQPAAPAIVSEAAPEAAPTLPTTGDGAVIVSVLEKVCVPAVRGGSLDQLAKAAGFKLDRRSGNYVMGLGGDRAYTVNLWPMSSVNANVCQGEVRYAVGGDKPIVSALNIWSFLHQPELILQANYVNVDPDGIKRVRKSWEHLGSDRSIAVNFSTMRKPDDTPLNPKYDSGMLFYQERSF